jgi:hypothetical protein
MDICEIEWLNAVSGFPEGCGATPADIRTQRGTTDRDRGRPPGRNPEDRESDPEGLLYAVSTRKAYCWSASRRRMVSTAASTFESIAKSLTFD